MTEATTTAITKARYAADPAIVGAQPRFGFVQRVLRKPNGLVGFIILILLVLIALGAPWLATVDPLQVNPSNTLQPPGVTNLMGTDNLGRDVWSRFAYGSRISLLNGFIACALGATVGVSLGVLAGYYGKAVDSFLVWVSEVLLAFPGILLAMVILAVLGSGMQNVVIAVGIALIPSFLRMARASVLSARNELYVEAARTLGVRDGKIMFRHILPNIARPLMVLLTLGVGGAILEGAALSFLGLGAQPPSPEWGAMLNAAQNFMRVGWWMGLFPGMGIFLAVLSINLLGDALSDVAARID